LNIWAWVRETRERLEQGDAAAQRLAELMRELPSAAADEAHERVDAMAPEAIALARELEEPWPELFIRHWNLQSRVLHRRQAGDELREAVALLDFSSGPRTQACPQSVCAVQDLAVCYAIRDGPGYVQERLAVARETLARIDPSWSCFDCISAEYFSALLDDRRPAEALEFIEAQIARQAEHGDFEPGFNMILNRARALAQLGRAEQALALLDGVRNVERYGRSRQTTHRQARVTTLLALGRDEEALALHPPLAAIRETAGHFHDWVANHAALIDRGMILNNPEVGRELLEVQRRLERNGARWDTANTAMIGARLALARGARAVARLLLDDLDRALVQLRRPELLREHRRELGERLTAMVAQPQASDDDDDDPEHALERLDAARQQHPDDPDLQLEHAAALRRIGRADMARALLERAAANNERVTLELARTLLAEHDHAGLDALLGPLIDPHAEAHETESRLTLAWVYGESLRERGELSRAIELDRAELEREPRITPLRLRLAANARALGDWATALLHLDIAAATLEPSDVDWDRITAATVLGDWATARAAAARLGISLPGAGDEPIELDLGVIRCEFVEPSGRRERAWARRTSPCGARIIEIALPGDPQHFRDRVVFEPVDLDAHARTEDHRPCYEVVAILEPGGFQSFLLRGWDPGRERVEALRERVREAGFGFERITAEGRSAADPRDEQAPQVATVGLLVAMAETDDPARLRALISEAVADWELPLLAPKLDVAAGDHEAAARSSALLERWKP
jgi:tetratricopeptide (TPR) repeat protein